MGLHRAGFEVHGVDVAEQIRYPFTFTRADALEIPTEQIGAFDLVWASPPCQGFTAYKRRPDHVKPRENLIHLTRDRLLAAGVPYIIENVMGARAELRRPVQLCGTSFGLDVQRHRLFECSWWVLTPTCDHGGAAQYPQSSRRPNKRRTVEIGAWRVPMDVQERAMGIDWMSRDELTEAIPPAFSEYLATQWLQQQEKP